MEAIQVAAFPGYFVEEAAKELGVLGLFPQERGQKHLFLDVPLPGNRHNQRQQIQRHALFSGLKERGLEQQRLAFVVGTALPVEDILGEVDAARIPDAKPLGLVIEPHGENIVT